MKLAHRWSQIVGVVLIVALLSAVGVSSVFAANTPSEALPIVPPPGPVCGPAIVDGNISEWNLATEFFADMYRAGNASKPVESKLYVRFDPATDTLYVLVLAKPGVDVLAQADDAYVKLGNTLKLVDGNSGNNGVPPDFAWVGRSGNRAQGWEASMPLVQGTYTNFNVHTQVWDDGEAQTSAVKDRAVTLKVECEKVILIPPVAEDDSGTTLQNTPIVIPVVNNDTDTDGVIDPTTVSIMSDPSNGSVEVDPVTGEVTYTPDLGFLGEDNFTYRVCDDDGLCDTAVVTIYVIIPTIDVEVTVTPEMVYSGNRVTWYVVVTNIDDDPLIDVTLTDTNGHNYGAPFDLAVGESQTFVYTSNPRSDVINVVTASGTDPLGGVATDMDSAEVTVISPAISVVIWVNPETVHSGDPVQWNIIATNTGSDPLTNVTLTDSNGHNYGATFPLGVGENRAFSYTSNPTEDVTNIVTATGTDSLNGSVTDTDDTSVNVINPGIDVEITVTPETVYRGDPVTWDVIVTNTSNDPLTNVTLTDSNGHNYGASFALAVGESRTFQYPSNPMVDILNTVTATGKDSLNGTVTDTDNASVNVISPAIDVEITVAPAKVHSGDQVTWDVVVTNTGDDPLTNVALTDSNGHDYGAPFALAVGASRTFQYTSNPTTDVTNTATATGRDSLNGTVTDTDDASVTIINPAIDVEITVSPETIYSGDQVTWDVVVTNTGDDPLTNVVLTDSNGHNYSKPFALAVGVSRTFQYKTKPTADVTNTVKATGKDSLNGIVTDTDSASVNVISPAIDVEITVAPAKVHQGDQVTWDVIVTNTGDDPLTNVVLTDSNGHDYGAPFALAVGASRTFQYTSNPTTDVTNTATATGRDSLNGTVTDTDAASVSIITPAIDVEITVAPGTVYQGDQVTWKVVVKNTGDDPLTNVVLTDSNGHNYGAPFALAVGASRAFQYTSNPVADVTNIATATGKDSLNGTVTDTDSASVNVIAPAIDVEITVAPGTIHQGDQVTWDVVVTNTGDDPLTHVRLTDSNGHNYGAPFALAVGASRTFQYTSNPTTDVTNTATATGRDSLNGTVTDTDSAMVYVIIPSVEITKDWFLAGEVPVLYQGGEAFFEILVENTGDVPLTNVTVTDALAPDCDRVLGDMAIGAGTSYTCSLANVQANFTNVAVVIGTDPLGGSVSDDDDADVEVVPYNPGINIIKDLLGDEGGEPLYIGDDAVFQITVQNTGDVALYNVIVTDVLVEACDFTIGSLMVGESTSYTCIAYGVTESFTNTAVVEGVDVTGQLVTDTDDAEVVVVPFDPAIEIVKSLNAPDGTIFYPGDDISFIIVVTNIGTVPLDAVTVADMLSPACDHYVGHLSIGESVSYTCVVENVEEGFVNVAVVTAVDEQDETVTDDDDAEVLIVDEGDGDGDGDGDGNPGYQDPDSDGDGIPDSAEGAGDTDGDGVPDYQDTDSDGDGIPDADEGTGDTDNDGIPDYLDVDSDGDGIPDADEGAGDTDSDGIPDYLDVDSDGDGIPDSAEGAGDTDGDGIPDFQDTDADGDGIPDADEGSGDTDGDGTPDFQDTDADGDGIPDVVEGNGDTDGDGVPDYLDLDSDADGIPDVVEGDGDTDGDGVPDFQDLDTDGDGIPDAVEGAEDVDGDGLPNFQDLDSDGDGIPGAVEGVVDSDGDGTPDYLDLDSDNDGIPDADEGVEDVDGDGIPNYLDLDSDGDGIMDSVENTGDANADGVPDPDADGDGIPNYLDLDSDADGIPDATEGTGDVDGDSIPNYLDPEDVNVNEMPYHVYMPLISTDPQVP